MNVYDFDKTIYNGDSTIDFYFFCLKRKPLILKFMVKQFWGLIKYKAKKITKEEFKSDFLCFFQAFDDIENMIEQFWLVNFKKIKPWYLDLKQENDLIISASPNILVKGATKRLAVNLIATKVNKKGKLLFKNCYGKEKVIQFKNQYTENINYFYSDSLSDLPMKKISKKAFLVNKNTVKEWI